jgi:threonine dehydrogenase-like Zn-dependent dehydrogenase
MANVNAPFGLRPARYLNGAMWNGQVRRYLLPSSDTNNRFVGDPVTLGGDAGASGLFVNGIPAAGLATCAIGVASAAIVGCIVGFEPDPSRLDIIYGRAGVNRIALVADDPNLIFQVQEITGGTPLTSAAVGLNIDLVAGTGSTVTGFSAWGLDNSTEATTNTLNCKLLGLAQIETNDYGDSAIYEVMINEHIYRRGITGV